MKWVGGALAALTPIGRLALILAVVLGVGLVAIRSGFRWDPFGLSARRLDRAEARAAVAEADAAARELEVLGGQDQARRLEARDRTVSAARAATAVVIQQSGAADDASVPLDPARAARLHAHDRELCRITPDLVGCAAAPDPG